MKLMRESVKLKFLWAFAWLCGGLLCLLPHSGHAEQLPNIKNLKLGYSVYVGGIHAMDGEVTFTRTGPRYSIALNTGTQGFLRHFAPWDARVDAQGSFRREELRPHAAKVVTIWKNSANTVNFAFSKNRIKAHFDPPDNGSKNEPVPEDMKQGALDPLSSVLQIIANITAHEDCDQTVPVYDGHRRFDLTLSDSGSEDLDGEDYSVFSGTAQRCMVDFKMLAGARTDREGSHFWQDGTDNNSPKRFGRSSRPPVYIFLGKVRDDLPDLPVRAETSTVFGAIMVHLTKVAGGKGPTLMVP